MRDSAPVLLVVDDSATIRKMIMTALRPLHPAFHEASSGLEAVEQLTIQRCDAVTLDLNMPDMHGLEFLQFMRSHTAFQSIPVVVVTTRSSAQMRLEVLSAGANAYLTKPFTAQALLNAVQSVLAKASM